MLILVKVIGIYLVAMGIIILLRPKAYSIIFNFFRQGKRIYMAGILRILFGALFLSVADESRFQTFLLIMGVLAIIGGITIFVLKPAKLKTLMDWFEKKSPTFIRTWGVVAIIIGALFIYSV